VSSVEDGVGRLVGLGRRAKKLAVGVPQVETALRHNKARLVLVATDGSYGQKKGVFGLARKSGTPIHERFSAEQLGDWVGADRVTALAVLDAGFADGIAGVLGEAEARKD
jgi:ribosomal protein L7Ae-like RNA K-turn-binding protein